MYITKLNEFDFGVSVDVISYIVNHYWITDFGVSVDVISYIVNHYWITDFGVSVDVISYIVNHYWITDFQSPKLYNSNTSGRCSIWASPVKRFERLKSIYNSKPTVNEMN
jgi:hypothetical protein